MYGHGLKPWEISRLTLPQLFLYTDMERIRGREVETPFKMPYHVVLEKINKWKSEHGYDVG